MAQPTKGNAHRASCAQRGSAANSPSKTRELRREQLCRLRCQTPYSPSVRPSVLPSLDGRSFARQPEYSDGEAVQQADDWRSGVQQLRISLCTSDSDNDMM